MKSLLARIFSPILNLFETDQPAVNYKPSHRIILNIVGLLFSLLSAVSLIAAISSGVLGGLIPGAVFFAVALVTLVVGTLGSDNAVAKIWGNRS